MGRRGAVKRGRESGKHEGEGGGNAREKEREREEDVERRVSKSA